MNDLLKAFEYGVDYGLLMAEEERDSEDMFDAVLCGSHSKRYFIPSQPAQRRRPHSQEWRKAMGSSVTKLAELIATQEPQP